MPPLVLPVSTLSPGSARQPTPPVWAWLNASAKMRLIGPRFDPDNAAFNLSGGSVAELVRHHRPLPGGNTDPPLGLKTLLFRTCYDRRTNSRTLSLFSYAAHIH